MQGMWGLILLAAIAAEPEPTTVCLTQLWEFYDYDDEYQDETGSYAELVTWAWTVEVKQDIPGSELAGWRYVGFIQLTRILWYDNDEEEATACWRTEGGKCGTTGTAEDAAGKILKLSGYPGDFDIHWR